MTIEELIIYGKQKVHSDYAKMLLADLINENPLALLTMLDRKIDDDIVKVYKDKLEELVEKKPIQYVIGNVNFYGYIYNVNNNVLIPRFETEELVDNTLKYIDRYFNKENIDIIDLGTGSGCIGITLKKEVPTSSVTLVDISKKALEVAKENAKRLEANVELINNDMLEGIDKKYDIVISNPPYIKMDEEIEEIVKENEPHLALYGGVDGLEYYEKILRKVKDNLKDKYLIAFEIGDTLKNDIISLVNKYFKDVNIVCKKDIYNRDRMVFISNLDIE